MPEGTHRVLSRDEGEMDIHGASRRARHAERLQVPWSTNMKQLLSNKAGTTSRSVTATEKTAIDICPAGCRGAKNRALRTVGLASKSSGTEMSD